MKENSKQRLFEMMERVGGMKVINEEIDNSNGMTINIEGIQDDYTGTPETKYNFVIAYKPGFSFDAYYSGHSEENIDEMPIARVERGRNIIKVFQLKTQPMKIITKDRSISEFIQHLSIIDDNGDVIKLDDKTANQIRSLLMSSKGNEYLER